MNDFLIYHNIVGDVPRNMGVYKPQKEIIKHLAKMQAIADTTDIDFTSSDVYYDMFDGTNDKSIGKIDSRKVDVLSNTATMVFVKNKEELSKLERGLELTIVKDKFIERIHIKEIGDGYFTLLYPIEANRFNDGVAYRSMASIDNNVLSLYPPSADEYDIRYIITPKNKQPEKIYSWVTYNNPSVCDQYDLVIDRIEQDSARYEPAEIKSCEVNQNDLSINFLLDINQKIQKVDLYLSNSEKIPSQDKYDKKIEYVGNGNDISIKINVEELERKYSYRIVSHYQDGTINDSSYQTGTINGVSGLIKYKFRIHKGVEVPDLAVELVGESELVEDWDSCFPYNKIRPVVFNNGAVTGELQKENFYKYLDGSGAPSNYSRDDVMIEFPKIFWNSIENNNYTEITISNMKFNNASQCYAHKKEDDVEVDEIYIGAYPASAYSGKLYSNAYGNNYGDVYVNSLSIHRSYASARGAGYCLFNYQALTMIRILFLLRYQNINSDAILGKGRTNTDYSYHIKRRASTAGMTCIYSSSNPNDYNKLFGLMDICNNGKQVADGIGLVNDTVKIARNCHSNNNTLEGYDTISDVAVPEVKSGKIVQTSGASNCLFLPTELTTIETEQRYYSDNGAFPPTTSTNPTFYMLYDVGGSTGTVGRAGLFSCIFTMSPTSTSCTSRLMYV